jgi:hypothetical protein
MQLALKAQRMLCVKLLGPRWSAVLCASCAAVHGPLRRQRDRAKCYDLIHLLLCTKVTLRFLPLKINFPTHYAHYLLTDSSRAKLFQPIFNVIVNEI